MEYFDYVQEKGLRIAWQYKKYFGENQPKFDGLVGEMVLPWLLFLPCIHRFFG